MKTINKNSTLESIYSTYRERQAVRAIVVKDNKVLLIHSEKYNTYTLPGGGVEAGESLEQAVVREAREETGMAISIIQKVDETIEVFDERNILNITTAFSAKIENESAQVPDQNSVEDGQELVWIALNEAVELIERVNKNLQHSSMLRDIFFVQKYLRV